MRKINSDLDDLMGQTVRDLEKTPDFLFEVPQGILKCLEIETEAFQALSEIA
jgi:hypothetical protein